MRRFLKGLYLIILPFVFLILLGLVCRIIALTFMLGWLFF